MFSNIFTNLLIIIFVATVLRVAPGIFNTLFMLAVVATTSTTVFRKTLTAVVFLVLVCITTKYLSVMAEFI